MSGATAQSLKAKIKYGRIALKTFSVIIHVGTNDLKSLKPHEVLQNILSLVYEVRKENRKAPIGVPSIIQRPKDTSAQNFVREYVNSQLKSHSKCCNFEFLKMYRAFCPDNQLEYGILPGMDYIYLRKVH